VTEHSYIHGTDPEEQKRLTLLNRLTNQAFLDFLQLTDRTKILEIGCGLGILTSAVSELNPNGEVYGIEASPEQLSQAAPGRANLHFLRGDAHHLPFEKDTFDLAYCRYVLEHVANPASVVKEAYRVLRPEGRFLVCECNIAVSQLYPDCPTFDSVLRKLGDLQSQLGGDAYIGKKLYAIFKQSGFRKIESSLQPEIHHAGTAGFEGWLENLAGNIRSCENALIDGKLATRDEIDAAYRELVQLASMDYAAAYFYWNRIVGVK
jgi:ubiquinone/menaquinone biosynthesis C-methylase UbiE